MKLWRDELHFLAAAYSRQEGWHTHGYSMLLKLSSDRYCEMPDFSEELYLELIWNNCMWMPHLQCTLMLNSKGEDTQERHVATSHSSFLRTDSGSTQRLKIRIVDSHESPRPQLVTGPELAAVCECMNTEKVFLLAPTVSLRRTKGTPRMLSLHPPSGALISHRGPSWSLRLDPALASQWRHFNVRLRGTAIF